MFRREKWPSILSNMWTSLRFIPRILQRPKVLMFLSVITIFFLLNRSKYPEMLKAHVNFKGIERAVSFEKGDKVIMLRYLVIVAFSDVRLDKVPPDCVKLRKYDDSVHDYVPLPLELKLVKDLKVQVKLPSTPEEMSHFNDDLYAIVFASSVAYLLGLMALVCSEILNSP
ncbi:uncharacterized protein LOC144633394 [Oculina patagonica]